MRATRLITAVITFVLLALLPIAASPASSAPAAEAERARAQAAGPAEDKITARVVPRKREGLFFVGGVESRKGPVYVQMATKCNKQAGTCNYKFYRKLFLKKGRYEVKISAPPGLVGFVWRAKVRSTFSDTWLTCTKTKKQSEKDVPCKIPF